MASLAPAPFNLATSALVLLALASPALASSIPALPLPALAESWHQSLVMGLQWLRHTGTTRVLPHTAPMPSCHNLALQDSDGPGVGASLTEGHRQSLAKMRLRGFQLLQHHNGALTPLAGPSQSSPGATLGGRDSSFLFYQTEAKGQIVHVANPGSSTNTPCNSPSTIRSDF